MTIKNTSVPTWWEQKSFKEFRAEYINADAPLFFIGSGISRWMGLPNWKDLLINLASFYDSSINDYSSALAKETAKRLADINDSLTYQKVGTFIKDKFDQTNKDLWRDALEKILNDPKIINKTSEIHDIIMHLKWRRIVTPNYDQLLELAAKRQGKEFGIAHPWNEEEMKKLENNKIPYIFKIHGDINDSTSEIVITEEDYDRLYSDKDPKNPDDPNIFKRTLGSVLRSATTTLFMGYSHDDPYLKKLYNDSMIRAETSKVFALVERSGENFEKKLSELTEELKIKFISYSGGDNHSELFEFLKYLADPEATDAYYRQLVNVKKPTIIMLHCGGTISSEPRAALELPLSVIKKTSRYDKELADFSTKLLEWYKNSYNSGNNVDIDIIWEILPKEFQMFSENATPTLWNEMRKKIENIIFKYFHAPEISEDTPMSQNEELKSLYNDENQQYLQIPGNEEDLSYKRFLSEFKNRYILGVVVLFGTDTLAYLAAALSFSLQHLPCPIIITGANSSPVEQRMDEKSQYFATSDTWKNLMTSIYFLQCFGHRMREIFVCFGSTIHNCINLRKRSAEIIPAGRSLNPTIEPFTYRNVSPYYQYMFKFIDGIFCNNYYTSNYSVMLDPNIRHFRFDALKPTPSQRTIGNDFCSVVQHVTVSPNFPLIDVKGMLAEGKGKNKLRAFLVEGYPSGTYPTISGNNFTHLVQELYDNGIPIILVSRYGILANQQDYDTIPLPSGVTVPVLHLFGIIAETALPLMSMGIGQISDADWNVVDTQDKITSRRIELIRQEFAQYFEKRPDIISEELKYIIRKNDMSSHLEKHYYELEQAQLNRKNFFKNRGEPFPFLPWINAKQENRPSNFVTISRHDFKLLLEEFVRTFEQVGVGPDGFEVLYNVGFDIGIPIFKSFTPKKKLLKQQGHTLFKERSLEAQQDMIGIVNYRLQEVSSLLSTSGICDISVNELKINMPNPYSEQTSLPINSFSFEITINRYGYREREDVKYAVMTFSDNEADFFGKLSSIYADKQDNNSFVNELEDDYKKLIVNTWQNSTQTIDWLILGIFKSITCGIAQYLRFDRMAVDSVLYGVLNSLRQAVKVNVQVGDEDVFVVDFSYYEKKPSEDK